MVPRLFAALAAVVLGASLSVPVGGATDPNAFGPSVKLTQWAQCGGYEPSVTVDRYGNVMVTAHKQNQCLPAAYDPSAVPPARSASWLWTSSDGTTFTEPPTVTPADKLDFGDEGDLATDDAGHLYFVDTKVGDVSVAAWKATGPGKLTATVHNPAALTAQPADDRPWMVAHGDGTVLYFGNEGDKQTYTSPNGNGGGRYTAYMSHDGGATFDHLGITLADSGWCRPAADHAPGSKIFYAACTDDNNSSTVANAGKLLFYKTTDDGASWSKTGSVIDTYNGPNNWVFTQVAPDGSVYVAKLDKPDGKTDHIFIYRSQDQGATWTKWDATPVPGADYASSNAGPIWLAIAPNGSLGLDFYMKPVGSADGNYYIYAATTPAFQTPFTVIPVNPGHAIGNGGSIPPWGDFLSCAFGPDNRIHVVYTDANLADTLGQNGLNSDIYYAVQVGSGQPPSNLPEAPVGGGLVLVGGLAAASMAALLARRRRRDAAQG